MIVIFSSHYFIPIHYHPQSEVYWGHQKVYVHQLFGTGQQLYGTNNMTTQIPNKLLPPIENVVSILVVNMTDNVTELRECMQSIQNQIGDFMIECVFIDYNTSLNDTPPVAKGVVDWFKKTTRFLTDVKYFQIEKIVNNMKMDNAVLLKHCTSELIFIMNSNDIMGQHRIQTQIKFMNKNLHVMCCGGQTQEFNIINGQKKINQKRSNFPYIINEMDNVLGNIEYSTICYRKLALEKVNGIILDKYSDDDYNLKLYDYFGIESIRNVYDTLILKRI
jgi:hypothetical protein